MNFLCLTFQELHKAEDTTVVSLRTAQLSWTLLISTSKLEIFLGANCYDIRLCFLFNGTKGG